MTPTKQTILVEYFDPQTGPIEEYDSDLSQQTQSSTKNEELSSYWDTWWDDSFDSYTAINLLKSIEEKKTSVKRKLEEALTEFENTKEEYDPLRPQMSTYPKKQKISANKVSSKGTQEVLSGTLEKKLTTINKMFFDFLTSGQIETISMFFTENHTWNDVINIIYHQSQESPTLWEDLKLVTIGTTNIMEMLVTKSIATIQQKCPIQYGGNKFHNEYIGEDAKERGAYGELFVFKHVLPWIFPQADQPGKICKKDFPVLAGTPDYIFHDTESRSSDCVLRFKRSGKLLGIGETKTSLLGPQHSKIWETKEYTITELLTKSKPKMIANVFSNKKAPKPSWIPKQHLGIMDKIMHQVKNTIRWFVMTNPISTKECCRPNIKKMNMDIKENQMYPKLFTSAIGRQILAEALVVIDYIESKEITIAGFFPSVELQPQNEESGLEDISPEKDDEDIDESVNEHDNKNLFVPYCAYFVAELEVNSVKTLYNNVVKPKMIDKISSISSVVLCDV